MGGVCPSPCTEQGKKEAQLGIEAATIEARSAMSRRSAAETVIESFEQAVLDGTHSLMHYYIEENPELNLVNHVFENGNSALSECIQREHRTAAFLLIENQANINHINLKTGDTPLHIATRIEDLKTIAFLTQKGCLRGVRNNEGLTAINIAKEGGSEDVIEILDPPKEEINFENINGEAEFDALLADYVAPDEEEEDREDSIVVVKTTDEAMAKEEERQIQRSKSALTITPSSNEVEEEEEKQPLRKTHSKSMSMTSPRDMSNRKSANFGLEKSFVDDLKKHVTPVTGAQVYRRFKPTKHAVVQEMVKLRERQDKLPKLEGWIEKQQPHFPYSWQTRWVVVRNQHLLWSDKQRYIDDVSDPKERAKFNGSLDVLAIRDIEDHSKSSKTAFVITALDPRTRKERKYQWKVPTEMDKQHWVNGIKAHQKFLEDVVKYLEETQ